MLPTAPVAAPPGCRPVATVTVMAATESTASELATIADSIGDYRRRVASLAEPFVGTERDDLVVALHEAERQLRVAERALLRAVKSIG